MNRETLTCVKCGRYEPYPIRFGFGRCWTVGGTDYFQWGSAWVCSNCTPQTAYRHWMILCGIAKQYLSEMTYPTTPKEPNQTCNECGDSVAPGSGRFVNRVPDLNDADTRKEMGKPFPKGDYICEECDNKCPLEQ